MSFLLVLLPFVRRLAESKRKRCRDSLLASMSPAAY